MVPSNLRALVPIPLLLCVVLSLIAYRFFFPIIFPTHDDSIQLTVQSPNFFYKVTTYYNINNNRCAFLRCGPETAPRYHHDSSCDLVFAEISKEKTNRSARFCAIDYIHSQWPALSRRYNEGFTFLSDNAVLVNRDARLPLDANAVHFPTARNHIDLSVAWLSVWPSNTTRDVFRDWYNAVSRDIVPISTLAPEQATLNKVRSCHAPDIVCHDHAASIAWQCDATVRNIRSCLMPPFGRDILRYIIMTIAIVSAVLTILVTFSVVLPPLRRVARRARDAYLTTSTSWTAVLCIAVLVVLAGESWVTIVHMISRAMAVNFAHELDSEHMITQADIFRAVPNLRGVYTGYAYIMRDGRDMVRISGPGVSIVVGSTSVILFLKRVFYGGLLVRCLTGVALVRLACDAIAGVAGRSKMSNNDDDDEYVHKRSEITQLYRGREHRRSFVSVRDVDSSHLTNVNTSNSNNTSDDHITKGQ